MNGVITAIVNFFMSFKISFSAIVILLGVLTPNIVSARPNPDQTGICYYLVGEEIKSKSQCILSTGYGTGIHYEIQQWSNGNKVEIYSDYSKSEQGDITVNDQPAIASYRNGLFFTRTDANDSDSIPCIDIVGTEETFCSIVKN